MSINSFEKSVMLKQISQFCPKLVLVWYVILKMVAWIICFGGTQKEKKKPYSFLCATILVRLNELHMHVILLLLTF